MLRQGEPEAMLMLPELRCARSGLRDDVAAYAGFRTRRRLRLAVKRPVAEARRAVAGAASDLRAVQRVARLEGRFIAYDASLHYALGAPLCTVLHRNRAIFPGKQQLACGACCSDGKRRMECSMANFEAGCVTSSWRGRRRRPCRPGFRRLRCRRLAAPRSFRWPSLFRRR